jgi:hypothetical protein
VSQQAARVISDFEGPGIEVNQAHPVAAQSFIEEIAVPSNEGWTSQGTQQRNDFIALHSLPTNIASDLAKVGASAQKSCPLALEHVFVQDDHT